MSDRDRDAREAREALERVQRDTETLGSSALARMGQRAGEHFGARDAIGSAEGGGTDPVELWGRRIGRMLSLIGVVILGLWLLVQLDIF
jgi:tetrahydromethanopterin S-methyltransferase subunit G